MKRAGNLWSTLISWSNLLQAALSAAQGKRRRPDVAVFLLDLEPNLIRLQADLREGAYKPGEYRTFLIREPKPRQISAAPFRDRVVHHALTQIIGPLWERRFSAHSYACRPGLGTHMALDAAAQACRRFPYVLQCDIRRYFASIDHQILKAHLARAIKCRPTLALAAAIIDGSNEQQSTPIYFPGDTLFTPFERPHGLPLGNQTSQFFANVYLNRLDHFIERTLQPGAYMRYVDDFLLFGDDKATMAGWKARIEEFLLQERLTLHPGKSRIYRCADGISFLGWRIFPDHQRLLRGNVVRFRRRLKAMIRKYNEGKITWDELHQSVQSWIAHASHGDTWKLREQIFDANPIPPKPPED